MPGVAKVGTVIAAKMRAYWSRIASSTTAAGSSRLVHSDRANAATSLCARSRRSFANVAIASGTEHRAHDPAGMVVVVDEVDQVTEDHQRVGAVPGLGQCLGVAVHV